MPSMTTEPLPDLDKECFFIAPIGAEGTETRERSDGVMEYIVAPAAHAVGLVTIRADKIAKPGQITRQVIEHVVGARASVVDLTGANPNVYYEMAVRHTAQSPTVLIAQDGEKLPFDISQMRTIFFDHTSLKSAAECREQIAQHLREAMNGEVDSPIAASVSVQRLEQGTAQERVLAQMVDGIDEIRARIRAIQEEETQKQVPPDILRVLARTAVRLHRHSDSEGVRELSRVASYLARNDPRDPEINLDLFPISERSYIAHDAVTEDWPESERGQTESEADRRTLNKDEVGDFPGD
jgi:hypothetical protein